MAKTLTEMRPKLANISYKSMQHQLTSKGVITSDEKERLDKMISSDQMSELLGIIIADLKINSITKYKGFLESMENSEDLSLNHVAKNLGK